MAQQTSIDSYIALKAKGELGKRQLEVLNALEKHPKVSDRELAELTGLHINQVTGRRNELCYYGMVKEAGKKWDSETERRVLVWEVIE